MKYILIVLAVFAATAPAYAGMHCYTYQGRMVCCTTFGNITTCN